MNPKPQPRTRRAGRRRWAELVRYLTATMKTSASERVRMTAALRLADVLTVREERELAEIRAAARIAAATQTPLAPDEEDTDNGNDVRLSARSFLARIQSRDVENGASCND